MPSNSSKYSPEMREQTARFILENNRSATSVAEEMGRYLLCHAGAITPELKRLLFGGRSGEVVYGVEQ